MKCPKCSSLNIYKVSVLDKNYRINDERCRDCGYQDNCGLFCSPPLYQEPSSAQIEISEMLKVILPYNEKINGEKMETVKIKLSSPLAKMPEYKTTGSSGMDVRSIESITIDRGQVRAVKTGLSFQLPKNTEIQVRSRSGLAAQHGVMVLNSPGTLDSDYIGELFVIIANFGNENFSINIGDRIAQIVFADVKKMKFEVVDTLSETDRGTGGLGSTGIK